MIPGSEQRTSYTHRNPCPKCGSYDGMPRGKGKRCHGYTLEFEDGSRLAYCAREESGLPHPSQELWGHRVEAAHEYGSIGGSPAGTGTSRNRVFEYVYTDRYGDPIARKIRLKPKSFFWEVPDEGDGWRSARSGEGNPETLYNLVEVVEADTVHLHEGEKAADALAKILPPDHASTCIPVFSSQFSQDMLEPLRDKHVTVWVDRDEEGLKKARKLSQILPEIASTVQCVQSATTVEHDDAFDHVAAEYKVGAAVEIEITEGGTSSDTDIRPLTAEEIYEDEIPQPILEHIAFEGCVTIFGGLAKQGKTANANQQALCIAAGAPFLGFEVRRSHVLYCSWEVTAAVLRERLELIARDCALPSPRPLMEEGWLTLYAHRQKDHLSPLDLTKPEGWDALGRLVEQTEAEVVFVDTLQKVAPIELKRNEDWGVWMDQAMRFTRERRIALVVIDHVQRDRAEMGAASSILGAMVKGTAAPVIVKITRKGEGEDTIWDMDIESWFDPPFEPVQYRRPRLPGGGRGYGCERVTREEGQAAAGKAPTSEDIAMAYLRGKLDDRPAGVPEDELDRGARELELKTWAYEKVFKRYTRRTVKDPERGWLRAWK